jgi:hypothetical protein
MRTGREYFITTLCFFVFAFYFYYSQKLKIATEILSRNVGKDDGDDTRNTNSSKRKKPDRNAKKESIVHAVIELPR